MRARALLAPFALAVLSGCLASKDDIRLLQLDNARLDTLVRRQSQVLAQAVAQAHAQSEAAARADRDSILAILRTANDSIRVLSARLMGFQASVNASLYDFGQQQIAILERTGLSQRELLALNARMQEQRGDVTAPPAPGDTTANPAGPGPDLLFS